MIWSPQQQNVFGWFRTSEIGGQVVRNLVTRARAGTGKTTTILEAIQYAPEANILLAAFNTKIAKEMERRLKLQGTTKAVAKTLHSVGNACIAQRWGYIKVEDAKEVAVTRADDLTRRACEAMGEQNVPFPIARLISKLHTKGREILPHAKDPGDLIDLAVEFECEPEEEFEKVGLGVDYVDMLALMAMDLAAVDRPRETGIDFADMIYLPIRNKWLIPKYDMVVVDEAQDMSFSQLEIAMGVCGGRICIVGDDRQAIYGFRGADSNSIDRLKTELQAGELGLNTTYRCGKSITGHAARLVPDFRADDSNHEGVIRFLDEADQMVAEAQIGDFILSRKNAPIAAVAMALIRADKPVCVAGKNIGKGLESLARKLATATVARSMPLFLQKLRSWEEKECKRAMRGAKTPQQGYAKVEAIQDKVETMVYLCDGMPSVDALILRIVRLFSDYGDPTKVITCSSIHKSKGLAARRVYVLQDTLYPRAPMGVSFSASRLREEQNLEYVAVTRAIHELVLVAKSEITGMASLLTQAERADASQTPNPAPGLS